MLPPRLEVLNIPVKYIITLNFYVVNILKSTFRSHQNCCIQAAYKENTGFKNVTWPFCHPGESRVKGQNQRVLRSHQCCVVIGHHACPRVPFSSIKWRGKTQSGMHACEGSVRWHPVPKMSDTWVTPSGFCTLVFAIISAHDLSRYWPNASNLLIFIIRCIC